MDSDIPSGAAAIGGRIENPLQDEDEQRRRAANTRLLRLRQLRFIVVASMAAAAVLRQPCFIVTVLKIYPYWKKEWFPAESDPSVRIPWYLSRRVQRWKEDWTGECMRGKRKALLSCMAALDMAVY